jgi:GNAT superfamily N-acetyltransferase
MMAGMEKSNAMPAALHQSGQSQTIPGEARSSQADTRSKPAAGIHESVHVLRDGTRVTLRPIGKGDRELERQFIEGLSPTSRHFRFLGTFKCPSEELLTQLTDIDSSVDAALLALTCDGAAQREVGVARFCRQPDGTAEAAVTVTDDWQHKGLGTLLMQQLIEIGRARGIASLYSVDSAENSAMQELAKHLGFERNRDPGDMTQVIHTLKL